MYDHCKRHGHTIVRYPNGAIHYYGEYDQDAKTGVWKTYDENGELVSEVDYSKDGDENNAGTILQPVKK
jgi:antitoxin component YwqK of YwqJK toxin-antitoxin module